MEDRKCIKCDRQIPEGSLALQTCIPCTMTELNRFMSSPRSVVMKNIENLSDCSIETLHDYWQNLSEFNNLLKMFHNTQIKSEIAQGNIVKTAKDYENVVRERNKETAKKETKQKRQLTTTQKADAKVVRTFLRIKPGANAATILNMMGDAFSEEWDENRVAGAMEYVKDLA